MGNHQNVVPTTVKMQVKVENKRKSKIVRTGKNFLIGLVDVGGGLR